jgi:hypothetical protein
VSTPRIEHLAEGVTLYLGDCREILPVLPRVKAVVTDPPYGTQDLAGGYGRRQNWDSGDGLGRTIANDHDLSALQAALPLITPLCPSGWLFVFYGARKTVELQKLSSSLNWFGEIIWDKLAPGLGYHIRYVHEGIAVYRMGEPDRPDKPLLSIVRAAAPADLHPHEKPIEVLTPLCRWAAPPPRLDPRPLHGLRHHAPGREGSRPEGHRDRDRGKVRGNSR